MRKWISGFETLSFRVEEVEKAASEGGPKEIHRQELRRCLD
jgi:hypothetical protein